MMKVNASENRMKKIAVIGSGVMGSGIAQVAVEAGYEVTIRDIQDTLVEKALSTINRFLGRKVEKNTLTQGQFNDILGRLRGTISLDEALEGANLVIEAIPEKMDIKKHMFGELGRKCPADTILASNTSTLSITEIASAAEHPERVVGTHFFNPVPLMRLVEVVKGEKTADEVIRKTVAFCDSIGKNSIVAKDVPGFIVNRFLCLLYNEGAYQVQNNIASKEDIDKGLKLGANHPMGILELMDIVGIDVVYYALQSLWESTNEDRYKPCSLLKEMVDGNRLGKKTGKGFYSY
jgi:3-hydroxybutyryl-CoA dehydrogenase